MEKKRLLFIFNKIPEFSLDFSTVQYITIGFENPSFIFVIRCVKRYQSKSTSKSMVNHEKNHRVVGGNHSHDGDRGMQVVWD
jgi:hypothetical protein